MKEKGLRHQRVCELMDGSRHNDQVSRLTPDTSVAATDDLEENPARPSISSDLQRAPDHLKLRTMQTSCAFTPSRLGLPSRIVLTPGMSENSKTQKCIPAQARLGEIAAEDQCNTSLVAAHSNST
eukprot:TRINITY_DN30541_c0_g1_i2.p1 TRINITY_DN30541_c0_g1~~TRINITY_DN30541_c0_g1_i2.p1  ORF type:complete len:125 (-),score=20.55 TRINITY_DN30541_c0_g1_i2:276-650(-)